MQTLLVSRDKPQCVRNYVDTFTLCFLVLWFYRFVDLLNDDTGTQSGLIQYVEVRVETIKSVFDEVIATRNRLNLVGPRVDVGFETHKHHYMIGLYTMVATIKNIIYLNAETIELLINNNIAVHVKIIIGSPSDCNTLDNRSRFTKTKVLLFQIVR